MKFEQYKMLKEHALAACAAAGAPFPATKEINPILLAYIGDVVFFYVCPSAPFADFQACKNCT